MHRSRIDVSTTGGETIDDPSDARHIDTINDNILVGRLWGLHNLSKGGGQRHLVAEIHVTPAEELLHLGAGSVDAGQNGEDGLMAFEYLLV